MVYLLAFFLGLAVGSFLNVLIYRLPREEGVVKRRSHCPDCGAPLPWYDLIPLVSLILLRGKCRFCKEEISLQYPVVELATGLLFSAAAFLVAQDVQVQALQLQSIGQVQAESALAQFVTPGTSDYIRFSAINGTITVLNIVFQWYILASLLVIFVIDLKHYIIPDKVLFPAIAVTLGLRLLIAVMPGFLSSVMAGQAQALYQLSIINYLSSAVLVANFFLLFVLLTKGKGMGLGDVKYGAFMGLLLGFPAVIVGLYISFLTGAVVGVILILSGRKKFGQMVPFGPFLVLGTVAAMYWGGEIWELVWRMQ